MHKTTYSYALRGLAEGLKAVAGKLPPKQAQQAVESIVQAMHKTTDSDALRVLAEGLKAVANKLTPEQTTVCTVNLAELLVTDSRDELAKTLDFFKTRLPVAGLIQVLKSPLCVGKARQALLQQLGQHPEIQQRFATLWDMVDWIKANRPDLEAHLRTPPVRPESLAP
jgi:hypothetical protein